MDPSYRSDNVRGTYITDSVRWLGSQSTCEALDSLLSDAVFKSESESLQKPYRESARNPGPSFGNTRITSTPHHPSAPSTFTSSSSSSSSFTAAPPDSSTSTLHGLAPQNASSSSDSAGASSWAFGDYRGRSPRSPNSLTMESPPVHDPDQFLSMLKDISERVDGNFRSDSDKSSNSLRPRPRSKRIISASVMDARRTKQTSNSRTRIRSTPEASRRNKRPTSSTPNPTSTRYPGRSQQAADEPIGLVQSGDDDNTMDAEPPKPSYESMPPPPVPLPKSRLSLTSTPTTHPGTNEIRSNAPIILGDEAMEQCSSPSSPPLPPQQNTVPQMESASPPCSDTTPVPTPKLHPLLDPERKQRRKKLERTISASLASLPPEKLPASHPSSQTITSAVPPIHQQQHQPANHQPLVVASSRTRVPVNPSHPPPLGMRRTHTFPLASQNQPKFTSDANNGLQVRRKPFKPPLMPSSQPSLSTTSSVNELQTSVSFEKKAQTESSSNSAHPSFPTSGGDSSDDLPPSSDADKSFGEAVSFDVDMDALEATMQMYD